VEKQKQVHWSPGALQEALKMWIKDFWEWLTTSRAYRLLLKQNERLQKEVETLRADKDRLMFSMSPTLRSIQPKSVPQPSSGEKQDEAPKQVAQVRKPSINSWRKAKAQLEFISNSKENRRQRAIDAHAGMP
jgi:hypothetical protein